MANHKNKRASVISLTIFFLILLSTGLSGYYIWQGLLRGFDKYLPILCSTLLLDGLGIFALVFKVSFETWRRAIVPFVCSLLLLCVCSIHLAALANMRTWLISQDESDARAKSLDDDRHARNVRDANALVETTCAGCKPERKRRMYQSEMARLEKSGAVENLVPIGTKISTRSWGRRYVEDFATAVQLIFGLLCGLAMLVNNFVRMYAKDPLIEADQGDEWPSEIEVKRTSTRRGDLTAKTTTQGDIVDDTRSQQKTTRGKNPPGLKELRECLRLIAFEHPPGHFKADLKPDFPREPDHVRIRWMASDRGDEYTTHSTRAKLSILDDAVRMAPADFRARLEGFLRENGFFEA